MEVKYWHLEVTPFHDGLQKVKGKVDGFTRLKINDDRKMLLFKRKVKGEIASVFIMDYCSKEWISVRIIRCFVTYSRKNTAIQDKLAEIKSFAPIPLHLFRDESLEGFQAMAKDMFLREERVAPQRPTSNCSWRRS